MCHLQHEIVGTTVGAIVNSTIALTVASCKCYMQPNVQLAHSARAAAHASAVRDQLLRQMHVACSIYTMQLSALRDDRTDSCIV